MDFFRGKKNVGPIVCVVRRGTLREEKMNKAELK